MSHIKKFDNYNKVNEELYDGEQEVKRSLSEIEDSEKYKNFIDGYNYLVDRYGLRIGKFHKWSAIYDIKDKKDLSRVLLIDDYNRYGHIEPYAGY